MKRRKSTLLPELLLATLLCFTAIDATVGQAGPPGAPTNVQASVSGNTVSLTWGPPSTGGAPTSYTLLARLTTGGPVLATLPLGNVTSFSVAGPNGVFVLSVVATNASGPGPDSAVVTVTLPTVAPPPGAPTNLVASVLGNTATLSWTAPSSGGVVGNYLLVAGVTPGFVLPIASLPLPASATTTAIPGIPAGTYYVRMLAQNAGGASSATNEATLTVAGPSAPGAPTLNQPTVAGNTLGLSWTPGTGGAPTSYVLTALTPGGAVLATVPLSGTSVSFPDVPNGTYVLRLVAVNSLGASPASNSVTVTLPFTGPPPPITQIGNDITGTELNFGAKVALSADGTRMVVAANGGTGIGRTRVYQRNGASWTQLGADIMGEAADDRAGSGVDINAAGTRIAVGAYLNDGNGTAAGHVRVFDLVGTTWTQVGADLDGDGQIWGLGFSVAMSANGNRLIAGAPGVSTITGRAKVFELVGGTWTQLGATLTGTNEFGEDVEISSDGNTIAVSAAHVPGGSAPGAVFVYRLSGGNWAPAGNILTGDTDADAFGEGLSLSADGSRIAVAAPQFRVASLDIRGKVRVFDLVGATWTQVGGDVRGDRHQDYLGESLALSSDGTRFAATGRPHNLAKVYGLVNGAWVQIGANITTVNTFGNPEGLALAADGRTVALGFINGNPKGVRAYSIAP